LSNVSQMQQSTGDDGKLQQVQMMLDQLGKQQTNDALGEIMLALKATVEQIGRPKTVVRDKQGKVIGVQ